MWASMMLSLKLPSTTCVRHLSKKSALDPMSLFLGGADCMRLIFPRNALGCASCVLPGALV